MHCYSYYGMRVDKLHISRSSVAGWASLVGHGEGQFHLQAVSAACISGSSVSGTTCQLHPV